VITKYLLGSVGLKVCLHLVFFLIFIRICGFESQHSPCIRFWPSDVLSLVSHVGKGGGKELVVLLATAFDVPMS